ncbi:piggyBac transposable element-derived protein 4-like [Lineus longissimus]|uniref:piggyBac transposable element-derived protein 4-like n=1 Tax=Lineus longissimus TaxID=88925 RepID=UPI00315CDF55
MDVFELIRDETNRYALDFFDGPSVEDDLPRTSRFRDWEDATLDEIKIVTAMQIGMGLCWKPDIEDYFEGQYLIGTSGFSYYMSRNRYELISSFFHFNNNADRVPRGEDGYDPLFKVRPLLDLCISTYRRYYLPKRELSVDESMTKFKGRTFLRQYMPNKPIRYGLKIWALCESSTGFCLNWSVYTGRREVPGDYGLSYDVVRDVSHDFMNKGHHIYMDNFFSGPKLFLDMKDDNTGCCGTVRPGRVGIPAAIRNERLRKGDPPFFMQSGCLVAVAWHDIKRVHALSSVHEPGPVQKRLRHKDGEGGYRNVEKPAMIDQYNKYMGGVDSFDQQLGTYGYEHKSQKWYMPLHHRIRETALVMVTFFTKL